MPTARVLRALTAVLAATAVVAGAAPAAAHEGHTALPDGFKARATEVVDGDGQPVELDGVSFTVAPNGAAMTVTNMTDAHLEISGEQAGEPLLRVNRTDASVNARSPQAAGVEGAAVDPDAAAELIDLIWKRVEPQRVSLPRGGTVTFMDHRAVPGHPPVRADHALGDVVSTWKMPFDYDGAAYTLRGDVGATEPSRSIPWLPIAVAAGVLAVALVLLRPRRSRATQQQPDADPAAERITVS